MKKYFVLVMLSALTVSSCSENDRLEDPTEWSTPLAFSTYIGTSTKAADLVNTGFVKFTVQAYSYASTMADAVTAASQAEAVDVAVTTHIPALVVERTYTAEVGTTPASFSAWTYSGAYYWPAENYLNFFAYATAGLAGEQTVTYTPPTNEDDKPTLSYTATATIANQVDLVAASAVDEKDTATVSGEINLAFKHILTKINFAVTGEAASSSSDNYIYEVSAITVKNIESVGTYTYAGSDTANESDGATSTATGVGTWAMTVDGTNNQVDYAHFAPTASTDYVNAKDKTQSVVTGTSGSLMLIPQTHATGATAIIEVAYKVWQGPTLVADFTSSPKSISLVGQTWSAGQNILYNLTLPIGATMITFTTSDLESWETATTTDTGTDATQSSAPAAM